MSKGKRLNIVQSHSLVPYSVLLDWGHSVTSCFPFLPPCLLYHDRMCLLKP